MPNTFFGKKKDPAKKPEPVPVAVAAENPLFSHAPHTVNTTDEANETVKTTVKVTRKPRTKPTQAVDEAGDEAGDVQNNPILKGSFASNQTIMQQSRRRQPLKAATPQLGEDQELNALISRAAHLENAELKGIFSLIDDLITYKNKISISVIDKNKAITALLAATDKLEEKIKKTLEQTSSEPLDNITPPLLARIGGIQTQGRFDSDVTTEKKIQDKLYECIGHIHYYKTIKTKQTEFEEGYQVIISDTKSSAIDKHLALLDYTSTFILGIINVNIMQALLPMIKEKLKETSTGFDRQLTEISNLTNDITFSELEKETSRIAEAKIEIERLTETLNYETQDVSQETQSASTYRNEISEGASFLSGQLEISEASISRHLEIIEDLKTKHQESLKLSITQKITKNLSKEDTESFNFFIASLSDEQLSLLDEKIEQDIKEPVSKEEMVSTLAVILLKPRQQKRNLFSSFFPPDDLTQTIRILQSKKSSTDAKQAALAHYIDKNQASTLAAPLGHLSSMILKEPEVAESAVFNLGASSTTFTNPIVSTIEPEKTLDDELAAIDITQLDLSEGSMLLKEHIDAIKTLRGQFDQLNQIAENHPPASWTNVSSWTSSQTEQKQIQAKQKAIEKTIAQHYQAVERIAISSINQADQTLSDQWTRLNELLAQISPSKPLTWSNTVQSQAKLCADYAHFITEFGPALAAVQQFSPRNPPSEGEIAPPKPGIPDALAKLAQLLTTSSTNQPIKAAIKKAQQAFETGLAAELRATDYTNQDLSGFLNKASSLASCQRIIQQQINRNINQSKTAQTAAFQALLNGIKDPNKEITQIGALYQAWLTESKAYSTTLIDPSQNNSLETAQQKQLVTAITNRISQNPILSALMRSKSSDDKRYRTLLISAETELNELVKYFTEQLPKKADNTTTEVAQQVTEWLEETYRSKIETSRNELELSTLFSAIKQLKDPPHSNDNPLLNLTEYLIALREIAKHQATLNSLKEKANPADLQRNQATLSAKKSAYSTALENLDIPSKLDNRLRQHITKEFSELLDKPDSLESLVNDFNEELSGFLNKLGGISFPSDFSAQVTKHLGEITSYGQGTKEKAVSFLAEQLDNKLKQTIAHPNKDTGATIEKLGAIADKYGINNNELLTDSVKIYKIKKAIQDATTAIETPAVVSGSNDTALGSNPILTTNLSIQNLIVLINNIDQKIQELPGDRELKKLKDYVIDYKTLIAAMKLELPKYGKDDLKMLHENLTNSTSPAGPLQQALLPAVKDELLKALKNEQLNHIESIKTVLLAETINLFALQSAWERLDQSTASLALLDPKSAKLAEKNLQSLTKSVDQLVQHLKTSKANEETIKGYITSIDKCQNLDPIKNILIGKLSELLQNIAKQEAQEELKDIQAKLKALSKAPFTDLEATGLDAIVKQITDLQKIQQRCAALLNTELNPQLDNKLKAKIDAEDAKITAQLQSRTNFLDNEEVAKVTPIRFQYIDMIAELMKAEYDKNEPDPPVTLEAIKAKVTTDAGRIPATISQHFLSATEQQDTIVAEIQFKLLVKICADLTEKIEQVTDPSNNPQANYGEVQKQFNALKKKLVGVSDSRITETLNKVQQKIDFKIALAWQKTIDSQIATFQDPTVIASKIAEIRVLQEKYEDHPQARDIYISLDNKLQAKQRALAAQASSVSSLFAPIGGEEGEEESERDSSVSSLFAPIGGEEGEEIRFDEGDLFETPVPALDKNKKSPLFTHTTPSGSDKPRTIFPIPSRIPSFKLFSTPHQEPKAPKTTAEGFAMLAGKEHIKKGIENAKKAYPQASQALDARVEHSSSKAEIKKLQSQWFKAANNDELKIKTEKEIATTLGNPPIQPEQIKNWLTSIKDYHKATGEAASEHVTHDEHGNLSEITHAAKLDENSTIEDFIQLLIETLTPPAEGSDGFSEDEEVEVSITISQKYLDTIKKYDGNIPLINFIKNELLPPKNLNKVTFATSFDQLLKHKSELEASKQPDSRQSRQMST